ncbi:hypothetical protein L0P73_23390, partial [[Clostridium] innocuum]|uniref:hypothetical protein n=1 Tax=Clostridium innocuum TaxID=1522 RepID=UPI001EDD5FAE
ATDKELIKALSIGKSAFYEYLKIPEFSELLKNSRISTVQELKCAMFKRAIGFTYTETEKTVECIEFDKSVKKILIENGIDVEELEKPKLIKTKTSEKHALPDPTSNLILLKHWDKEAGWTSDPQTLELKKQEFEHRKLMDEEKMF